MWVGSVLLVVVCGGVDDIVRIAGCICSEIRVLGVDGGRRVATEWG